MSFTICLIGLALATGSIAWVLRRRAHAGHSSHPDRPHDGGLPERHRRRIADCFDIGPAMRADTRRPGRPRPGSRARSAHVASGGSFRQAGAQPSVRTHGRSQRGLGRSH